MTFKANGTDSTFAPWVRYLKDFKIEIPEGELGINPGGLSLSKQLDVVHFYGKPEGI